MTRSDADHSIRDRAETSPVNDLNPLEPIGIDVQKPQPPLRFLLRILVELSFLFLSCAAVSLFLYQLGGPDAHGIRSQALTALTLSILMARLSLRSGRKAFGYLTHLWIAMQLLYACFSPFFQLTYYTYLLNSFLVVTAASLLALAILLQHGIKSGRLTLMRAQAKREGFDFYWWLLTQRKDRILSTITLQGLIAVLTFAFNAWTFFDPEHKVRIAFNEIAVDRDATHFGLLLVNGGRKTEVITGVRVWSRWPKTWREYSLAECLRPTSIPPGGTVYIRYTAIGLGYKMVPKTESISGVGIVSVSVYLASSIGAPVTHVHEIGGMSYSPVLGSSDAAPVFDLVGGASNIDFNVERSQFADITLTGGTHIKPSATAFSLCENHGLDGRFFPPRNDN